MGATTTSRHEVIRDPLALLPGVHIAIERPKSGTPPDVNVYETERREAGGWLMKNGSHVPDSAPCWPEGRVTLLGQAQTFNPALPPRGCVRSPRTLTPGIRIEIVTGDGREAPEKFYEVARRAMSDGGWVMTDGTLLLDDSPYWVGGRILLWR